MDINLQSDQNQLGNIPLRFSVDFYRDIIIRNARDNNEWGIEETSVRLSQKQPKTMPIVAGDFFKIYFMILDFKFHIAINDQPYCIFELRQPLDDIGFVNVNHDLQSIIQFDHRRVYPMPAPFIQYDYDSGSGRQIEFSNDIPEPFSAGHVISITAIPYGNIRGNFSLCFFEGAMNKQALNFKVCFESPSMVIKNAMNDDLW